MKKFPGTSVSYVQYFEMHTSTFVYSLLGCHVTTLFSDVIGLDLLKAYAVPQLRTTHIRTAQIRTTHTYNLP